MNCETVCAQRRAGDQDRRASAITVSLDVFSGSNSHVYCRQCDDAPCAAACPKGAISRVAATGAWVVDPASCTGCGACVGACRYGAMRWPGGGPGPFKCDLCGGEPSCVAACCFGAIRFLEPCDPGFTERGMPASEQSPDLGRGPR